jgi:tripartite-type tricarboxylate transporter receptor subunit TctC
MDMEFWYCISAPAGTPPAVVQQLHAATIAAVRSRDYGEKLLPLGFSPVSDDSPAAFTEFLRSQDAVWRDLVQVSGARLD